MRKPKALKKGDTIGIIAPSGSTKDTTAVDRGCRVIEEMGFKVVISKGCRVPRYGYLASSDALRVEEIEEYFANPGIDGIVCMKGGYGTPRILDKIDYDIIKANPKVFVGYSDITGLHLAFQQKVGFPTFHAPMVISMVKGFDSFSYASWYKALTSNTPLGLMKNPTIAEGGKGIVPKPIVGGKAKGKITGGNLTLVADLVGTPYELDPNNAIIFLEDVDEAPYRMDRMLTQMRLAGYFDKCQGIILGDYERCNASDPDRTLTFRQIIEDVVAPCGKPIVMSFNAGHSVPTHSFPIGVEVEIDGDCNSVCFTESACE